MTANRIIVTTVFRAVALALGVAVNVLNLSGMLVPATAFTLLGLGLAALALTLR